MLRALFALLLLHMHNICVFTHSSDANHVVIRFKMDKYRKMGENGIWCSFI